jgi:hypothetical protein
MPQKKWPGPDPKSPLVSHKCVPVNIMKNGYSDKDYTTGLEGVGSVVKNDCVKNFVPRLRYPYNFGITVSCVKLLFRNYLPFIVFQYQVRIPERIRRYHLKAPSYALCFRQRGCVIPNFLIL